jgi:acetyl-CoA C-acetyltransferase
MFHNEYLVYMYHFPLDLIFLSDSDCTSATMSLISGRSAVIVSTARTGLAKSFRGKLNDTHGAALAGHAIQHAIARAGIPAAEVEDVFIGCGLPEGAAGWNVARNAALWAGCPVTTSGATINRFCSSGLQAVASASHTVCNIK